MGVCGAWVTLWGLGDTWLLVRRLGLGYPTHSSGQGRGRSPRGTADGGEGRGRLCVSCCLLYNKTTPTFSGLNNFIITSQVLWVRNLGAAERDASGSVSLTGCSQASLGAAVISRLHGVDLLPSSPPGLLQAAGPHRLLSGDISFLPRGLFFRWPPPEQEPCQGEREKECVPNGSLSI